MWCASIKSNYDCFLVAFPDFSSLTLLYSTDFLNSLTWRDRWVPNPPCDLTWRVRTNPPFDLTWRVNINPLCDLTWRVRTNPHCDLTWRVRTIPPFIGSNCPKKKGLTVLHHIQVILIHKAMPNLILTWFTQNRGILSIGNLLLC